MNTPEDAFEIDIRRDLERVDQAMSQVIQSPDLTEEFLRDPNGVLSRLGMHPETTGDINDRVNRIFYAVLTNRELVDFVLKEVSSLDIPEDLGEENDRILKEALERGEVAHSVDLDVLVADHFFRREDVLRRLYQLTLHDLNEQELLGERHDPEEIDRYVDSLAESILQRKPIRDIPELERWDDNYGVGTGYGVGEAEVGPAVTVALPVEVVVPATIAIPVWVLGASTRPESVERAAKGDPDAIRMIATAANLFRLAGEVMLHAESFRR